MRPAVEHSPAAWVPAMPRMALEASGVPAAVALPRASTLPRRSTLPRPLRLARLVLLLAVAGATFFLSRTVLAHQLPRVDVTVAPPRFSARLRDPFARPQTAQARLGALGLPAPPPPLPVTLTTDAAGSRIASISFYSTALRRNDRFLVYLPPHYSTATTHRYPVLYLLHGDQEQDSSFLRLGVPATLDGLIDSHRVAPMIVVMLQGAPAPVGWRNIHGAGYYNYVGQVQHLVDRTLRTVPRRSARAIAGYSMGGYGAMNIALTQLHRYSVVESWEGDFTNLQAELGADRQLLKQLPLHAFVWGGAQDTVVDSALNAPWAAAMRAAGADAQSAVYPGTHAFAPIEAHLSAMLSFVARALRS
jgi:S-formylglutathione hydrolase FrmB